MIQLLHWFQTNYPELKKDLQDAHHNFDDTDTNPYHLEGDCWSHTMLVCKVAQLKEYDIVVQVSALLHDIGKPQLRKINPENNHVLFWGHEELSAQMAKPLVVDLIERNMLTKEEADEVITLIALHGEIYKHPDDVAKELKSRAKVFKHLLELHECDDLGRFSLNMRED